MSELRRLVAEELSAPVEPRVGAMAEAIAAKHGGGEPGGTVLRSCLRQKQLEGLMLDFYLIVSDYRAAYDEELARRRKPADPTQRLLFRA